MKFSEKEELAQDVLYVVMLFGSVVVLAAFRQQFFSKKSVVVLSLRCGFKGNLVILVFSFPVDAIELH